MKSIMRTLIIESHPIPSFLLIGCDRCTRTAFGGEKDTSKPTPIAPTQSTDSTQHLRLNMCGSTLVNQTPRSTFYFCLFSQVPKSSPTGSALSKASLLVPKQTKNIERVSATMITRYESMNKSSQPPSVDPISENFFSLNDEFSPLTSALSSQMESRGFFWYPSLCIGYPSIHFLHQSPVQP